MDSHKEANGYLQFNDSVKIFDKMTSEIEGGSISKLINMSISSPPFYGPLSDGHTTPACSWSPMISSSTTLTTPSTLAFVREVGTITRPLQLDVSCGVPQRNHRAQQGKFSQVSNTLALNKSTPFSVPSFEIVNRMNNNKLDGFNCAINKPRNMKNVVCNEYKLQPTIVKPKLRPVLGKNAEYFARFGGSIFPPSNNLLPYSLDPSNSRTSRPMKKDQTPKRGCGYCKKLNRPDYESHCTKTSMNIVICPELRKYKCDVCGCNGGDNAHTRRYCPMVPFFLGKQYQLTKNESRV